MKYVTYCALAFLAVMFSLLCALLVNWWAPLCAVADKDGFKRLPNWLAWADTFDADLDTGNREMGWNQGYWGRVRWLYRNTGYGFDYWALGCPFAAEEWTVVVADVDVSKPWAPIAKRFRAVSSSGRFNACGIWLGIRYKFGWKAWNYYDPVAKNWKANSWGPMSRAPFTFSLSKA